MLQCQGTCLFLSRAYHKYETCNLYKNSFVHSFAVMVSWLDHFRTKPKCEKDFHCLLYAHDTNNSLF